MAPHRTRFRRGFTLVETVMAIAIAGILLAIATPRFTAMRDGYRLDTSAYQLAGDLRRAQVEAVKLNQTVVVAKTGATTYSITSIGNRAFAEPGIAFDAPAMTVSFASFGPPVGGGATFSITLGTRTKTVTVNANGLVTVQ